MGVQLAVVVRAEILFAGQLSRKMAISRARQPITWECSRRAERVALQERWNDSPAHAVMSGSAFTSVCEPFIPRRAVRIWKRGARHPGGRTEIIFYD